ncbi:MAG: phosphoenolpyruvate carboxykinase, partial [Planctomycetota bacterium]|nr:phosphoenolpyruvate carboxykinase [Planctomycetota bacterium]
MALVCRNRRLNAWVEEVRRLCQPDQVVWCDGSKAEYDRLMQAMVAAGMAIPLKKRPNSFLFRSHPSDVARVEDRTFIASAKQEEAGPTNNWIDPVELKRTMRDLYSGCMRGRTMYVIPFVMGPIGSPLARVGVQLSDSIYVAISMGIMTRMGSAAWDELRRPGSFTRCLHSIAQLDPR